MSLFEKEVFSNKRDARNRIVIVDFLKGVFSYGFC